MDERINVCKDIMKLSPCNLIESVRGNLLIKSTNFADRRKLNRSCVLLTFPEEG